MTAGGEGEAQARERLKAARRAVADGRHAEGFALLREGLRPDTDFTLQAKAAAILAQVPPGALGLRPLRLAILANSTVDHLADLLRLWLAVAGVEAEIFIAPYGTMEQTALAADGPLAAFQPQLVWLFSTQRDVELAVAPGADTATIGACVAREIGRRRVLWEAIAARWRCPVLQNNADLPADDPFGHLAGAAPWGRRALLRRYNAALAANATPGVHVFDLDHVAALWGTARWVDPRLWHHSKHAFTPQASGLVASHAARVIAALLGLARKVLVLDLDNTLWGGVVGDDGVSGLVLGQGAEGEAFVAFQRHVKALRSRGIVLAVCSKNDDEVARAPFREHPDMVLRLEDFAVFRANWDDKVTNLREIAAALALGPEALAFVDDNPAERELVRRHLPAVEVVDLPEDPAYFVEALARSGLFEATAFTDEDRVRADLYADNARREEARLEATDLAGFLASLEMRAHVGEADELSLPRIAQLINKSNQFHLTGLRLAEPELRALAARDDHRVLHFRLADRFGDNGLVSAVLLRRAEAELHVEAWVMSCRVLQRTLEAFVAREIVRVARLWDCAAVVGRYVASARNGMVAEHYARLGFAPAGEGLWRLALGEALPAWETPITRVPAAEPVPAT